MKKPFVVLLIFAVSFTVTEPSEAGIYLKYSDTGTIELTNQPSDRTFKLVSGNKLSNKADRLEKIIDVASGKFGMPRALILSILKTSLDGMDSDTEQMILPAELRRETGDLESDSTKDTILKGTRYLRDMVKRFDGNLTLALAGYYAGPGSVEKENGIPNDETRKWVQSVRDSFEEFERREEIIYTYRDKNNVLTVVNINPTSE